MRLFRRVFQRIVQSRLRAMRPNQRDWIVSELVRWARSQRSQYYPRPLLADEFLEMGRELGVRSFSIKGKLGTFEGLFADRVIAREFLIALDWAGSINAMLTDGIFREGRGTLLDIGANVGLTSIPVSAQRRIRSIAFEPEPTNFRYLRKNILENDVEDLVRPINIALFSKDDQLLDFELSESNLGDHHVSVPTQSDSQEVGEGRSGSKIKVRASRLDSVIDESELERPLAVKIDTQGCEVEVVRGGQRLLKSADWPRRPAKLLHLWPPKLPHLTERC